MQEVDKGEQEELSDLVDVLGAWGGTARNKADSDNDDEMD